MYSKITPKIWGKFKRWRSDEINKAKDTFEYKKYLDYSYRCQVPNLQAPFGFALLNTAEAYHFRAMCHIPDESLEECYKFALNNKLIK